MQYSTDGGANYPHIIATGEANDGSYSWSVPKINSQTVRVKVTASGSVQAEATSGVFTIDSEPPVIALLSQNDGAKVESGAPVDIRWEAKDNFSFPDKAVSLSYTTDGGQTYQGIAAGLQAGAGVHTWNTSADLKASTAQVRVVVSDRASQESDDMSDKPFALEALTVALTRPNGGELWQGSSRQTVEWTSNFNVGEVILTYSTDGGATYPHIIAESEPNDGKYEWTVPGVTNTSIRIKVTVQNHATVADMSDANFSIDYSAPMVRILWPNGGEVWEAADAHAIRWAANDQFGLANNSVTIKYSTDGGMTFPYVLSTNEANDSSYVWAAPWNLFSGNVRIRVEIQDENGLVGFDESDANFSLINPPPNVKGLPDMTFQNSGALYFCLNPFVTDKNDRVSTLDWSYWVSNDSVQVGVNQDNKYCSIFAQEFSGTVSVILTATDPHGSTDSDTMKVTILKTTTDVSGAPDTGIPTEFSLSQNYPNPFNPQTTIQFEMPKSSEVVVTIYNMNGRKVADLFRGRKEAGIHSVIWEALDCPSGTYVVRLQAGSFVQIRKCVLLK